MHPALGDLMGAVADEARFGDALSRYATPLKGLFLSGAGTHPGGISGAAGWNAADAVLEAKA